VDYAKKYFKYGSSSEQQKFNKLVSEMRPNMSLDSAISAALAEIKASLKQKKMGGMMDKPLGAGGNK
jgi:hypothetical protein|tara:strand:- start:1589 stop:1789 length:201 start_codon:yes stop_codon:yes gene_type:complete